MNGRETCKPIRRVEARPQRLNTPASNGLDHQNAMRPSTTIDSVNQEWCLKECPTPTNWRIVAALKIIAFAYVDPKLDLRYVAERTGITKCYLCRLFLRELGIGFPGYLCRFRAIRAGRLLLETVLSVKEVAWAVGFAHVTQLDRAFRSTYGCTPTKYRALEVNSQQTVSIES